MRIDSVNLHAHTIAFPRIFREKKAAKRLQERIRQRFLHKTRGDLPTAKDGGEEIVSQSEVIERRIQNRGFLGIFEENRGFGFWQGSKQKRFETSENVFDGFFPRKNFTTNETESIGSQSRGTRSDHFGEFSLLPLRFDSLRFEAMRIRKRIRWGNGGNRWRIHGIR